MATFNDESDQLYDISIESDKSRDDDDDVEGRENSAKLKSLRANVDWRVELQRREFLARLYPLVQNWRGRLPDLRDIFRPEEIDWLLAEEVTCLSVCLGCDVHALPIVDFVIASGYEDRPEQQPQPSSLCRVTPLHAVARRRFFSWDTAARRLFRIYNQFEVNYVDDKGLTHFHIACMAGCDEVVQKFLELGRVDPDLAVPDTGDSPLHLALAHCRIEVVRTLLRLGANPNFANKKSLTPLLVICMRRGDSDLLALLFEHAQERYRPFPINTRDPWGSTPLNLALFRNHRMVTKALLSYGADPNLANDDGTTPLHTIYDKRSSYATIDGLAETYFRICDERRWRVDIDARDSMGRTPLHLACNHGNAQAIATLLRRGADPNLASETGLTALHVACLRADDGDSVRLIVDVARRVGRHPVLIDARDKQGDTALHLALELGHMQSAEALLRRGADPNLANNAGSTPLHVVCSDYHDITELFFEVCDEIGREVRLDARDRMGDTPLHLALNLDEPDPAECLLRRGADWNLANDYGEAALHIVCAKTRHNERTDGLAELIFDLATERGRPVRIDALGNLGYAPLHFALRAGNQRLTALLLRRGADGNLTTEHGSTPLHVVCRRDEDDGDLAQLFFDVNAEMRQRVRVDALDGTGRTPLQWAVAFLLPKVMDVLLDQGADLAGFVFPARSHFEKRPKPSESWRNSKLKLVAGALAVAERLERAGYELDRADALTVMSLFAKYSIFETATTTADPKKSWYYDNAELVRRAKELRVKENLTLDQLIEAPVDVAAKLLGHEDYLELTRSLHGLRELPQGYVEALDRHLCEKASRRFFRSWALEPFVELTHCRLPLLCCVMVIDNLTNRDLYNICLAAEG